MCRFTVVLACFILRGNGRTTKRDQHVDLAAVDSKHPSGALRSLFLRAFASLGPHVHRVAPIVSNRIYKDRARQSSLVDMIEELQLENSSDRIINLLPFGANEILLPGETKQVHLFEERFLRNYMESQFSHKSCLGQFVFIGETSFSPVVSILQIVESEIRDKGVWLNLLCVDRMRIYQLQITEEQSFRAAVAPFTDLELDPTCETLKSDCFDALDDCRELEATLTKNGDVPKGGAEAGVQDRVEWGHEVHQKVGVSTDLRKLNEDRRERLVQAGVRDNMTDQASELQLFSFSVSALLPTKERFEALLTRNTTARLENALQFIRARRQRLVAESAIANALRS